MRRAIHPATLGAIVCAIIGTFVVGCAGTPAPSVPVAVAAPRPHRAQTTVDAADAARLDATEVAEVDAVGAMMATKPGTPVEVVRIPGEAAWNALSPDVDNGAQTAEFKSHEAFVVICTTNVKGDGRLGNPADRHPVAVGEIILLIDATTGGVIEKTYISQGSPNPWEGRLAALGARTTVTLSAASFADHP